MPNMQETCRKRASAKAHHKRIYSTAANRAQKEQGECRKETGKRQETDKKDRKLTPANPHHKRIYEGVSEI